MGMSNRIKVPTRILSVLFLGPPCLWADAILQETTQPAREGVHWKPLLKQSSLFLGIQHGFRVGTEPGTRRGLKGPFLRGYANSVGSLHGWADGDPFYVNYVGHPMQGSTSGYIFAQNDPKYRWVEFGKSPEYWKSRLRATAFSFAYSTQFEIGPFSEASIGKIQSRYPQQGFVDMVVTPVIGLGWMTMEDWLDKQVIQALERRTDSPYAKLLLRGGLNPSRSMANMLRGKVPWYRDTRRGVFSTDLTVAGQMRGITAPDSDRDDAPGRQDRKTQFEFAIPFQATRAGGVTCLGGGGSAAVPISSSWEMVVEAGGCRLYPSAKNLSGSSFTYMIGPRWTAQVGSLRPHLQALLGGLKVTQDLLLPERRNAVIAETGPSSLRERHSEYLRRWEENAATVALGGGIDWHINRALAFRIGRLEFQRAWIPPVNGYDFRGGLRFSSGLVVKMGAW